MCDILSLSVYYRDAPCIVCMHSLSVKNFTWSGEMPSRAFGSCPIGQSFCWFRAIDDCFVVRRYAVLTMMSMKNCFAFERRRPPGLFRLDGRGNCSLSVWRQDDHLQTLFFIFVHRCL